MDHRRGSGPGGPQQGRFPGSAPRGRPGHEAESRWAWARQLGEQVKNIKSTDAETIVAVAEKAGKGLKEAGLKMNQIRRFLTELRSIEADRKKNTEVAQIKDRVVFLRPKLAYAAGREERVRPLLYILDPALKSVSDKQGFQNLLRLVEGVVAYHRAEGGGN